MSDIICITSSDDDDEVPSKKTKSKTTKDKSIGQNKRKLSLTSMSSCNSSSKKFKSNNDKVNDSFSSSSSYTSNSNSDKNSKKTFENSNAMVKLYSPLPGTSKSFDKIEKELSNATDSSESSNKNGISPVKRIKPVLVVKEKVSIPDPSDDVFSDFLKHCTSHKKFDDEIGKVIDKLKSLYNQVEPDIRNSEEYRLFINKSIEQLNNSGKLYKTLLEVREETKRRIRKVKKNVSNTNDKATSNKNDQPNEDEYEELEFSKEDLKKIKLLEKTINDCKDKIKELELKEVDFDDEENSVYLMEDRYKRKMVELCQQLSKITRDHMLKSKIYKSKLRRKDISDEMTNIESIDQAIIDFVNSKISKINQLKHIKKKTAIAEYLTMPDYVDVLNIVKSRNKEKDLNFSSKKIEKLAQKAFKAVGRYLKKQRLRETEEFISSCADVDTLADPADKDSELKLRLQENRTKGERNLNSIFKLYEEKQEGLSQEDLDKENEAEDKSDSESDSEDDEDSQKSKKLKSKIVDSDSDDKTDEEKDDKLNKSKSDNFQDKTINTKTVDNNSKEENKKNMTPDKSEDKSRKNSANLENLSSLDKTNKLTKPSDTTLKSKDLDTENKDKEEFTSINKTISNEKKAMDLNEISDVNKNPVNSENSKIFSIVDDDIEILSDNDETGTSQKSKIVSNENFKEDPVSSMDLDDIVLEYHSTETDTPEDPLNIDEPTKKKHIEKNVDSLSDISEKIAISSKEKILNSLSCKNVSKESKSTTVSIQNDSSITSQAKDITEVLHNSIKKNILSISSIQKKKIVNDTASSLNVADKLNAESKKSEKNAINCSKNKSFETSKNSSFQNKKDSVICKESSDKEKKTNVVNPMQIISSKKDNVNKKTSSLDHNEAKHPEASFIKVKSFAKPPDSWKDSQSPIKNRSTPPAFPNVAKPDVIELTDDEDDELPSTSNKNTASKNMSKNNKIINPLAISNRRPVQNVLVVKNFINNYNVPVTNSSKGGNVESKQSRGVQRQEGKFTTPKNTSVIINQYSANKSTPNIVRQIPAKLVRKNVVERKDNK